MKGVGVQFFLPNRNCKDFPLERWYRELRIRRIGEGPNEVQRHIIARDIIGAGLR